MEKITSFTINHILLQPGVYVSRKDLASETTVTTFDIRMTSPNEEPVMNTAEVHTIEHLQRSLLRPHGLPYRFLPSAHRRPLFRRDSASDDRNVRVHPRLPRRGSRRFPERLRKLPGYESWHGKLPGQTLPGPGPLPHYPGPSGLSGIKTIPGSVRAAFDLPLPEPGCFYACFLLFFGSSFRKSR